MEIIVVTVGAITLNFVVIAPHPVTLVIDVVIDALDVMIGVMHGSVDMSIDVNIDRFAIVMAGTFRC